MGRRERRAAARKSGSKMTPVRTYTVTDAELKKIKDEAVDEALRMLLSIPVLVLHDKFGFGKVRLDRFLSGVNTWIKAVHQDEDTMTEVFKTAQAEAGYEIVMG